jgi:hypothetical protein
MSENFYTILTATGKAKLANSAVLGSKVNFKTLKVGDGNGAYYEPTESQTSLVREVWSGNVSSISVDENNPNWIVAETLIPATIGGFFIREAGIFDEDGDLIAISKLSETYKPVVSEGSIKDLCIKIVLEVSNVSSVTLKIDPTVIVATRKDIDVLQAKMDAASAQTAEEIKELDSKLSEQISELTNEISNKTVITPAVGYGMNNVIKNVGETSVSPKFTIQGKTVINLLGKDGNCEDLSKWSVANITTTLDNTNKVFGNNGLKMTLTSTGGSIVKTIPANIPLQSGKYYCVSAYLKNGNATNVLMYIDNNSGAPNVTDATKFNRSFWKFQYNGIVGNLNIGLTGSVGQYAYVDGIMLEEITVDQYNDSNFQPSPYVDSYACLQNPYIEVRHDNLVRNGNGEEGINWWDYTGNSSFIWDSSNGYFVGTDNDTTINSATKQTMDVVSGKTYIVSLVYKCGTSQDARIAILPSVDSFGNGAQGRIDLTTTSKTDIVVNQPVTIPNGCNKLIIAIGSGKDATTNQSDTGTYMFKNVMLVEGNTIPDSYKTCRIERCVVEGKFADGDSLVLENGEVTGQINWKHKTLFGKDYGYTFNGDRTGFKAIQIPLTELIGLQAWSANNVVVTRYDGKILLYSGGVTTTDSKEINSDNFVIGVTDTDTGWAESINPNNDEVKAFMNGWKAIYQDSVRYTCWESVVDKTPCPAHIFSTISSSGSGAVVAIVSASKFAVGDAVALYNSNTGLIYDSTAIDAINGNNITLHQGTSWTAGDYIVKQDTSILNYCKNNVAQGYEGYQLHYKLQNPEPLNDVNTNIHGDIPLFDFGDNYLYLDSGMVLGEVANPAYNSPNAYYINHNDVVNNLVSKLKNKAEKLITTYKNGIYNNNSWIDFVTSLAYGNDSEYAIVANFDTSAIYTIDYKILATQAPQIGALACSYVYDIISVLNKVQEEVNNKQNKDSTLDSIIDLSSYEIAYGVVSYPAWFHGNNVLSVRVDIPFSVNKKVQPKVIIQQYYFNVGSGTGQSDYKSKVYIGAVNISQSKVSIRFDVYDSTVISNIKTYGLLAGATIIADCRERI